MVPGFPTDQRNGDKEFVIRRAATNRVLNVLRHWVSKHSQVQFTFPSIFFLFSSYPSVLLQKKNNTCVMTLLLFLCWSSGLWAEHRAEDAGNWLPGGGDAWPRAPDTGKKGSCQHYQVGVSVTVSSLDRTYSHIWHIYLQAPCRNFCGKSCGNKNRNWRYDRSAQVLALIYSVPGHCHGAAERTVCEYPWHIFCSSGEDRTAFYICTTWQNWSENPSMVCDLTTLSASSIAAKDYQPLELKPKVPVTQTEQNEWMNTHCTGSRWTLSD